MHEHQDDIPSDIAAEDAEFSLPGGYGTDDPDNSIDATVDELFDNDVAGFSRTDERGGITSGTDYAEATSDGFSVDPADLLEGEEGHPGAGIGFTGEDHDKGNIGE